MIEHVDRVPTKPNRYAVYDEDHNFLRYEYHERADEPVQAGNPFNKALQDEFLAASGTTSGTASTLTLAQPGFVLEDGATARCILHIDTALSFTLNVGGTGGKQVLDVTGRNVGRTINKGSVITLCYSIEKNAYVLQSGILDPYEVGDYIYTKRTDMATNWIYLNGARYSVYTLPDLSNILSYETPDSVTKALISSGRATSGISICGDYAFFGTALNEERRLYRCTKSNDYTDTSFQEVYSFTISGGSTGVSLAPRDFIYDSVNGYYAFMVSDRIYYSTDAFSATRAFVTVTYQPVAMTYQNGKTWLATATGLYYCTDIRTNSWTPVWSYDTRQISATNGRLIACVYGYVSTKYVLAWSDNNGQTWSYSASTGSASMLASYQYITVDSRLFAVPSNSRISTSPNYAYEITSLENATVASISFPATGYSVDALCETELGYFVLSGLGASGAGEKVTISFQQRSLNSRFSPETVSLWKTTSGGILSGFSPTGRLVCFPQSTFCMISRYTSSGSAGVVIGRYWQYVLPTVTVTGAYAYMKYKEV